MLCISSKALVLSLNISTPRDSYAWNDRELATLLSLNENESKIAFVPLTIESAGKHLNSNNYDDSKLLYRELPLRQQDVVINKGPE